jgi:hypothetical protein
MSGMYLASAFLMMILEQGIMALWRVPYTWQNCFPKASLLQCICYHPQWSPQCLYRVLNTTRRFPRIHLSVTIHSGLRNAHTEYYIPLDNSPASNLFVTIHSGLRPAHTEYDIPLDDSQHPSICYHPQWSPHCSYWVRYSTRLFPASVYLLPSTVVSSCRVHLI